MAAQEMMSALTSAASAGGEAALEQIVFLPVSKDQKVASPADSRLASLGEGANPIGAARAWVALLARPEHVARAARELASLGAGVSGFADELLAALTASRDPSIDAQLTRALGKSGATPRIASALRDAEPRVRSALAYGLGFAGAAAIDPVLALASDADESVRWRAMEALSRIGGEAVPALTVALTDAARTDFAIEALTRIGPDARAASDALRALAEHDAARRVAVTRALAVIGR